MEPNNKARISLILVSVLITGMTVMTALPERLPEIQVMGKSAFNSAPAIRISMAGPATPKPRPEPAEAAPMPEQKPEPEPEPEPEPAPAPEPEPEQEPEPEPEPEPELEPVEKLPPEPAKTETPPDTSQSEGVSKDDAGSKVGGPKSQSQQQVELSAGDSPEVNRYLAELNRHLSRYYEYPRRARRLGQEGTPLVVFEFTRGGALIRHSVRQSSGHSMLDDATLAMLSAADPLPEVPASMAGSTFTYVLPVKFELR